ncbi:MAG: hypothetical protein KGI90_15955, partial [Burkholderiales bacterium]|nr:hypothetical protein [Burkholderiales bacterium]
MNKRSTKAFRFAIHGVALAVTGLLGSQAYALGLGRVTVQSALGETLKAEIDVTSLTPDEASSLKLGVASPDAYKAAGMDYHAVLAGTHVRLVKRPDGRNMLVVTSDRAVLEPFLDVIVEANWSSGRLVREYTMLFDPPLAPSPQVAQAAPAPTAPVVGAAPLPAPRPAPAPRAAPAA